MVTTWGRLIYDYTTRFKKYVVSFHCQIPHYLSELLQCRLKVFHDLLGDDVGIGEVEAGFIAGREDLDNSRTQVWPATSPATYDILSLCIS